MFLGPHGTPRKVRNRGLWKILWIRNTRTARLSLFLLIFSFQCSCNYFTIPITLCSVCSLLAAWLKQDCWNHQGVWVFFRALAVPQAYLALLELQEERWVRSVPPSTLILSLTHPQIKDGWKECQLPTVDEQVRCITAPGQKSPPAEMGVKAELQPCMSAWCHSQEDC